MLQRFAPWGSDLSQLDVEPLGTAQSKRTPRSRRAIVLTALLSAVGATVLAIVTAGNAHGAQGAARNEDLRVHAVAA